MKAINDKYFTKPSIVDLCLKSVDFSDYDLVFEPSAGCGSFLEKLPKEKTIGADISPDVPGVVQMDFYNIKKIIDLLELCPNPNKRYLSIGNPPFGKMSNTAIDFFNGCAAFSDSIAFILPRTFRKISVTNRLDLSFHLRQEFILPKNSFMVMNPKSDLLVEEYDVPCVFQVWDRKPVPREKQDARKSSKYLDFVSSKDAAKYAFRRVGALAGDLYDTSDQKKSMSPSSHFFINCSPAIAAAIRNIKWDYYSPKYDTAGNPSISKNELILELEKKIREQNETR